MHHDLVHCALPGSHGKRLVIEELQVSQCVWLEEHWASQHIDGLPQPQCNGQNTGSHNVLLEHVAGLIVYVCNTRSHYGIVWLWLDPWVCWCIMMARTSVSWCTKTGKLASCCIRTISCCMARPGTPGLTVYGWTLGLTVYEWSVLPTTTILLCPHCPLHIIVPTVPNVLLYSTSTSLSSDSDFPSYILTYFPSPHCICHGPRSPHCPHCTVIVLAVLCPLHCHLVSCTVLSNVLLTLSSPCKCLRHFTIVSSTTASCHTWCTRKGVWNNA